MALDEDNGMTEVDRKILIEKVAGNSVGRTLIMEFLTHYTAQIKTL